MPPQRMRRQDIEAETGEIVTPEVGAGQHLVEMLFQVGPFRGDLPLSEADLEAWERRRGIELPPWQAELVVDMSKAYMAEMHAAKNYHAAPPWPDAVPMWRWVRNQKAERAWDRKEKESDGRSKRR